MGRWGGLLQGFFGISHESADLEGTGDCAELVTRLTMPHREPEELRELRLRPFVHPARLAPRIPTSFACIELAILRRMALLNNNNNGIRGD